ncbi:efflux RND transporter permease subunit [Elongatibacter sediminis]|uniref:Efflux RND transporter permease subunit n=1 Tax=Elongatibacter sediminis TaxID=3119006 RepID=A0AAW9RGW1_9GAMM
MSITEKAVSNPAGVAVAVAIIVMFGLFSVSSLPVQLFPDIALPQMSVQANWRAASPREVESEILEPMEDVLQGLPGMQTLEANAFNGGAWINMQFSLDTNMQETLMDIIGRLNRLPPLPADADPPVVQMGGQGTANQALTWFFVQKLPGTPGKVDDYARQVEDILKPRLEAVDGVASVDILAGAAEELQITIDPYRAAEFGLPLTDVASVASQSNDVSGGFVNVGRRQYTLRFEGRYDPEQLRNQVLEWRDGRPVRLGDVAEIGVGRGERRDLVIQNGNPAMGVRINRQNGANVLEALTRVKAVVAEAREGPLAELGLGIEQSFDASVFIQRAVRLVTNNLLLGVLLAVGVLWWFLRDTRATLLIATAIPVSLLATFVVLQVTGRTLNVISLAGLAFAVGMVLDAAIVVSENIVRMRERGEVPFVAALKGTAQVKGALMASTATTVAIFLPVLFLEDVEGQLFADLALTIAIAVVASLFVALTILPAVAGSWLKARRLTRDDAPVWSSRLSGLLMRASSTGKRRALIITVLVAVPLALSWALFPQLDYLPPVKRDAVDAFVQMPPGSNWETRENEIAPILVERLEPYMSGDREPALKNYYIWLWRGGGGTVGARLLDQSRVKELEEIMRNEILAGIPDFRGFAAQGNLFGGFGGGRDIAVHMQAVNEQALVSAAATGQERLMAAFEGANVQAFPPPELAEPELRILPDDARIAEAGWNRIQVASVVRMLGNGLWLGEYFNGENRMDIILKSGHWDTPEQLEATPVMTPAGGVVPLGELVGVQRTTGPGQIRRVNGRRTVSLSVSPPENVSLETAITTIREQVEPDLRDALPADGSIIYGGSADSLREAIGTMSRNFAMALAILFLLMAGLFRSLRDSAMVVLTIPLAWVGGIIALQALNLVSFQPMDLLTMIGFIILLGLVVNNAILLVDRTRSAEQEGMSRDEAVEHALQVRMRPIFMSTFTSIFGMLPLVLLPGEGSVIYRGLATAIVGGMACSLIFTLLMLPSLLRLGAGKHATTQSSDAGVPPRNLESVA